MKIILIQTCSACPYGALWELNGKEYMCSKLTKVNKTGNKTVLDECELKDAKQFIKDIIKLQDA